jgi:F-type H+-transporting ATPase subunit a
MRLLGLLTGTVQAYIFAVLAMVYISSASRPRDESKDPAEDEVENDHESASKRKDS